MSQTEDADEPSRDAETADPRTYGLTEEGVKAAVSELEIEAYPKGRMSSVISLNEQYAHLIKRGRCEKAELLTHFTGVDAHPRPENGRYTRAGNWWEGLGRNLLAQLPGVEVDGANEPGATEVVRFTGLPPEARDEFDDDHHLVPLTELRGLKEQAADALDDMGVSGGRRELLLSLYGSLANTTTGLTSASLAKQIPDDTRGVRRNQPGTLEHNKRDFFDRAIADRLAQLPDVVRETDEPPAPEEIEIDTFADVLEAQEAVEQEEREVWRVEKRVEVDKRVGR